jgi:hypothetical protein
MNGSCMCGADDLKYSRVVASPGLSKNVFKVFSDIRSGKDVSLTSEEIDIHTVATIMMEYLLQLPDPLIPHVLYPHIVSIARGLQSHSFKKISFLH